MVLSDFKNLQRAGSTGPITCDYPVRAFQRDVLAPVKSVKRLSSQAWPFCVKNSAIPDIAEGSLE